MPDSRGPKVLHVHDAAFTAANIVAEARSEGLPWRHLAPATPPGERWSGPAGKVRRAGVGTLWTARLLAGSAWADLLHVHSATTMRHARLSPRRYVLHLHGSDTYMRYDVQRRDLVLGAIRGAAAVVYATADLREHVTDLRPDATHLPQPVDMAAMPAWHPPERPTVAFASRWHVSKGLPSMLALARGLAGRFDGSVDVVGLDAGPEASAARAAGVRLVAPSDHDGYLDWLSRAHVVVGQCSGMLGVSEVEALAIGLPVLAPVYRGWDDDPPPVIGPDGEPPDRGIPRPLSPEAVDEAVDAVATALADPAAVAAALDSRAWIRRHHDRRESVRRLRGVYAGVLAPVPT